MVESGAKSKEIVPRSAAERREARADRFFAHDLKHQREWYGQKAGLFRDRSQRLSLAIITAGAAIATMGVFAQTAWGNIATAVLGGLIAVAKGWERIARYDEA
jgi:Protein of unknown function (DUF4231)